MLPRIIAFTLPFLVMRNVSLPLMIKREKSRNTTKERISGSTSCVIVENR